MRRVLIILGILAASGVSNGLSGFGTADGSKKVALKPKVNHLLHADREGEVAMYFLSITDTHTHSSITVSMGQVLEGEHARRIDCDRGRVCSI